MAFFYLNTSILKTNQGKSAVASAAYMSGSSLYSERLGRTFSYTNKEEVVHSEINFCENTPSKLRSRSALWNEVERNENRSNSRLARCFIVALPKEWADEECIKHSREFIQKTFVDRGMCADWAYHKKDNCNPHLHIQVTIRGFEKNGKWAKGEKKEYVLDENGEKIPELDANGNQKVRVRVKNGKEYTEKIWKRRTVEVNHWNNRQFLNDVKREWAETANRYLPLEQHIDGRSYKERRLNRVPLLHEGIARKALERGVVYDVVRENQERRAINEQLSHLEKLLAKAKEKFISLKERYRKYKEKIYEQRRSGFHSRTTTIGSGTNRDATGFDIVITRRNRRNLQFQEINDRKEELEKKITNRQPYRGM